MDLPLSGHFHWREVAVGVALFGIGAYFLWPKSQPAVVAPGQAETPNSVTIPGIPDYLSYNRPGYTVYPTGTSPDAGLAWSSVQNLGKLALPGGLFKQPDGSITGGNYIGGNYVGARTSIYNPGAIIGTPLNANAIRSMSCGCG